jgi:hypothetical protein
MFHVIALRKCFAPLYAERNGVAGMRPSIEETLMMWPPPRSLKCGRISCTP